MSPDEDETGLLILACGQILTNHNGLTVKFPF